MQHIAIIGNHTDAGKTIASAIICEALKADYWKPIQAGTIDNTDTMRVQNLLSNTKSYCHPEAFRLTQPVSPHLAAQLDHVTISMVSLQMPQTSNTLVIETAGGLFSPVNDDHNNLDLIKQFNCPVILVSGHYLGSINHTLLTAFALRNSNIKVLGVLFNGEPNPSSESHILNHTGYGLIGHIPKLISIDKQSVSEIASRLSPTLTSIVL